MGAGNTFIQLVGVLGFVPGTTTDYDSTKFAGHESGAELLGVPGVGGGAVYLALWPYGLIMGHDSPANFVPLNGADDWPHFFLGLGMIALGLVTGRKR